MVGVGGLIEKQGRRTVDIEDCKIQIAIVVDVSDACAAARLKGTVIQTSLGGDLLETLAVEVAESLQRLAVFHFGFELVHQQGKIAVGDDEIWPTVVVEVARDSSDHELLADGWRQAEAI